MKYALKIMLTDGHFLLEHFDLYKDAVTKHKQLLDFLMKGLNDIITCDDFSFRTDSIVALQVVKVTDLERSNKKYMNKVCQLIDKQLENEFE